MGASAGRVARHRGKGRCAARRSAACPRHRPFSLTSVGGRREFRVKSSAHVCAHAELEDPINVRERESSGQIDV